MPRLLPGVSDQEQGIAEGDVGRHRNAHGSLSNPLDEDKPPEVGDLPGLARDANQNLLSGKPYYNRETLSSVSITAIVTDTGKIPPH